MCSATARAQVCEDALGPKRALAVEIDANLPLRMDPWHLATIYIVAWSGTLRQTALRPCMSELAIQAKCIQVSGDHPC